VNALKFGGLLLLAAAFIAVLWVVAGPATGIAMTVFFIVGTAVHVVVGLRLDGDRRR
jgi:hypothetical protein